ncbi:MAG TPA: phage terminase large subunit family protein, partial [Solirubrobacterales bacterium]|nr:phage terminase large subunit family protein [Solirubrobacterales bacterium]
MIGEESRSRRADAEHQRRGIKEYAQLVPEANLGPLRLDDFPYQIEPFYSDEIADAEEVVYEKSTQIGASTALWRWAVRRCDQFAETTIYFFPTSTHVTEFGDERIEPSIRASDYLSRRIPRGHTRRKTMKQIGPGILQLRGMQSKAAVQSVAAQAVVIDEYDECPDERIAEAEQRMSGAEATDRVGRVRRSGRPSLPGYGIDAAFEESDKRRWFVTCPECQHEQIIDFHTNMRWRSAAGEEKVLRAGRDEFEVTKDVVEVWRACERCEASLEGDPILHGRWIATATGAGRVPGFHIPRLIVPRTNLRKIVVASRRTKFSAIENFHNADLGVPYAAADAQLTDEDIDRAMAHGYEAPFESYRGRFVVTMGVDVASERDLSVRITEHHPDGSRRMLKVFMPSDFEEVAEHMERFNVTLAAVDSMPERRLAKGLMAEFPGRVVLVEYEGGGQNKRNPDSWRYDEKTNTVHINRTEAIDAMMESIREGSNWLLKQEAPMYREQLKALKRRTEEDEKGNVRKVYVTTGQHGD